MRRCANKSCNEKLRWKNQVWCDPSCRYFGKKDDWNIQRIVHVPSQKEYPDVVGSEPSPPSVEIRERPEVRLIRELYSEDQMLRHSVKPTYMAVMPNGLTSYKRRRISRNIPAESGVYMLIWDDAIQYIGSTFTSIRRRLGTHELLDEVERVFYQVVVGSALVIATEYLYIHRINPARNKHGR